MLIFDQVKRGDPKLRAVSAMVAFGMALLLSGLWYVQVVSAKRYKADLADQSFRIVRIPAIRGKILDRNGNSLAENRASYNVDLYFEELRRSFRYEYTNGELSQFRRLNPNVRPSGKVDEALQSRARYVVASNLLSQVSSLIQQPQVLDEKLFTNHYNNLRSLPFPLLHDLSPEQIARFVERSTRLPSLTLEVQPVRSYPFGKTAAHLLGYVKRNDDPTDDEEFSFQFRLPDYVGEAGIEKTFDQQLRGRPGVKSVLVNNLQYRQSEEIWTAPEPGKNVILTIDLSIQQATERALRQSGPEARGAAVVLDCRNGDVLAMASEPSFNPNIFTSRVSEEQWAELQDEKLLPQLNRATLGIYQPGSIFKIIVSLAGLESGVLKTDEVFQANPPYRIDGRGHPWKCTAPAGSYVFDRAFYLSCNCYFIDHGLKIGFERIAEMGRRFGLGQRTGFTTRQEAAGYYPEPSEKIKKDGSRWMPGDTANLCIGQGELFVTPLQMAVMTAVIADGGKVFEPRLVDRIEPQEAGSGEVIRFAPGQIRADLKLNPQNLEIVKNAMLLDVEHQDEKGKFDGTGRRAAVEGMRICGKTGTAQVIEGLKKKHVAWFVSFAPFDAPRYVVVVVIEEGDSGGASGAGTCAPVAHDIYEGILQRERGGPAKVRSSLAAN